MRIRSMLIAGMGIGASLALNALATPALADQKNSKKGPARPQVRAAVDNTHQTAIGDLAVVQTNINDPIRLFKPGDAGPVKQFDDAQGSASNESNTPADQIAIGQVAVVQLDANLPVRVGSPGTDGPVTQVSRATGTAFDKSGPSWTAARQSTSKVGQGEQQVDSQELTSPDSDPTQLALPQGAVAQIHINTPINVLSSRTDAPVAEAMKSAEADT